jgi:PKHD-type hydroxylase
MRLDPYFFHIPGGITKTTCEEIIEYGKREGPMLAKTEASETFLSEEEKKFHSEEIRENNVVWINDFWIFNLVGVLIKYANSRKWNFTSTKFEDAQFTEYFPGGHYNWHRDCATFGPNDINSGLERKLSCVVQLSKPEDYEGGEFSFNLRGLDSRSSDTVLKPPKTFREQGSVIVFPSFLWHKVEPITKGKRYSMVMWTLGEQFK